VITDLAHQAIVQKKIACGTSGEELRQFLYVDDCARALLHQFESGQKYADITSWEWVPLKDVVNTIVKQRDVPFTFGEKKGGESFAKPSIKLEGWSPAISLEEGVSLTLKEALADLKVK
jgi:nucleoside-diphosphate-sugar epimerase